MRNCIEQYLYNGDVIKTESNNMKLSFLGKISIFLLIALMCTNQYFQVWNIPVFALPWCICFIKYFTSKNRIKSHEIQNSNIFLYIWILYAFFLLLFNYNDVGFKYFMLLFINISVYIILLRLYRGDYIRLCNKAVVLGLFVNIVVALWEVITGQHIKLLTEDYERMFTGIPTTFYANANDLSTFLIVATVVVIIEILLTKSRKYKLFLYITLCLTAYVIWCTKSNGGILGFGLLLILYFIFYRNSTRMHNANAKIITGIYMFMILALITTFVLIYNDLLTINMNTDSISVLYQSSSARFEIWKLLLDAFTKSWLLGIGPGQCITIYDNAHFILLEILVEYGIFICLGVIILFFTVILQECTMQTLR